MKKILESWKLWTVLSAFIFMMTFSLVVYAATNLTTSSPYTAWKTSSTDKILDEDEWNMLMNKLQNQANNAIPAWAIMAFTGPTCPSWWTRYAEADGRFLMGGTWSYGSKWWANSITLTVDQLPPHSHIYKDTLYSESLASYGRSGNWDNESAHSYVRINNTNEIGGFIWSNQSDGDNYPVYWIRATESVICKGLKNSDYLINVANGKDRYENCNPQYQENIDITNAYVKVLFCKKN